MVKQWVRELVDGVIPPHNMKIGDIVDINGRKAEITSGQYWGTYGLSNHWHWRYLDGKVVGHVPQS